MTDECITGNKLVVFNYRTNGAFGPCFVGPDDQSACSVPVTECGIRLEGVPRNDETEDLFRIASKEGFSDILSVADAYSAALDEKLPDMPKPFFLFRLFRRSASDCYELGKQFVANARKRVAMFSIRHSGAK